MNELTFIMSQMRELRSKNDELKTDLQAFKVATSSLLQHMNASLHKIFVAPAVRKINQTDESVQANQSYRNVQKIPLIKCPRTLGVLWTEYEFGLGGNKPVKIFTPRERCMVKFGYSLRKPFWLLVEQMIKHGYTRAAAIEKIENVYTRGQGTSITAILRQI